MKKRIEPKHDLEDILAGNNPSYQTNHLRKRLLKSGYLDNCCDVCGLREWNGKPIVCELDHINGIRSDHRLENIRLLCPNCHSQTSNFRGKNKKNRQTGEE